MSKKRDHQEMERRRNRAARMFEKGCPAADVSKRLGVARQVGYRWKQAWEQGGKAALASKGKAGRKPKLSAAHARQVVEALIEGPDAQGYKTHLWTLPRVALLIHQLTGVRYHPGHVWRVLGALGFSCQRPERRAIERDGKAIGRWKRSRWPVIKKKPAGSAAPSSSSTRAD
jgi:transposase